LDTSARGNSPGDATPSERDENRRENRWEKVRQLPNDECDRHGRRRDHSHDGCSRNEVVLIDALSQKIEFHLGTALLGPRY
jgi:hypothetical protein